MKKFIAKVLGYAWKYGVKKVKKVAGWVKNNWKTVLKWIETGLSVPTIIEMVLRILGIG